MFLLMGVTGTFGWYVLGLQHEKRKVLYFVRATVSNETYNDKIETRVLNTLRACKQTGSLDASG